MSTRNISSVTCVKELLSVRESSSSYVTDQVRRHLDAISSDIQVELNTFTGNTHNASILKEALDVLQTVEKDFGNIEEKQLRTISGLCSRCLVPQHKTLLICALLNLKLACNNSTSERSLIEISALSTSVFKEKLPRGNPVTLSTKQPVLGVYPLGFLERVKTSFRIKSKSQKNERCCSICGKFCSKEFFSKHFELCTTLKHIGETCEDEQLLRHQIIALLELYSHGLSRSDPNVEAFEQLIQLLQAQGSGEEYNTKLKEIEDQYSISEFNATDSILFSFVEFLKMNSSIFESKEQKNKTTLGDFAVIKPISRGAFGRVYLVLHKSTGQLFALKALQKDALISQKMVRNVVRERNILALADNPFIVKCHWAFTSIDNVFMVMEYVPGGDCHSLLQSVGCVSLSIAKKYTAELVCALQYLHSKGIVHRDLKPDNILIGLDGHIKLTDFGLSTMGHRIKNTEMLNICLESQKSVNLLKSNSLEIRSTRESSGQSKDSSSKRVLGTPDYLSPEALNGDHTGPETDWWALGAVLFELIAGYPPFTADTVTEIFHNLIEGRIQWPAEEEIASYFTPTAVDLITKLLCSDPRERLGHRGTGEIKNHEFFNDVSWSSLLEEDAAFVPRQVLTLYARNDYLDLRLEDESDVSYFVKKPFSQASMAKDLEKQVTPRKADKGSQDVHDFFSGFSFINPKQNHHGSVVDKN